MFVFKVLLITHFNILENFFWGGQLKSKIITDQNTFTITGTHRRLALQSIKLTSSPACYTYIACYFGIIIVQQEILKIQIKLFGFTLGYPSDT